MNANGIGKYGVRLASGKIKDYKTLDGAEKAYQDELASDYTKGSLVEMFEYTDTVNCINPIKSNMDN